MTATAGVVEAPSARSPWRSVALPSEHGGWGLTLEPGVLGLMIAPSVAGLCIALAAMVAFLARTPLKIVAVDRRRGRVRERTRRAQQVAGVEVAVLALLVAWAVRGAGPGVWVPGLVALPLIAVEGWFEVRSRGRRLVPELAGAVAVSSVAAMVALAGGQDGRVAAGVWLVLAARATTSIPHVRAQIARLHSRPPEGRAATIGDLAAAVLAAGAVGLDRSLVGGAAAVLVVVGIQRISGTKPVPRPVVLGLRQMAMGIGVVIVTAIGVLAAAS